MDENLQNNSEDNLNENIEEYIKNELLKNNNINVNKNNSDFKKCHYHDEFEISINKKYDVLLSATGRHSKKTDSVIWKITHLCDSLVGTIEKKGIIHELKDSIDELNKKLANHIDEDIREYRPVIKKNSKVCDGITKMNIITHLVITTIVVAVVTATTNLCINGLWQNGIDTPKQTIEKPEGGKI